jgi:hypothetical protein
VLRRGAHPLRLVRAGRLGRFKGVDEQLGCGAADVAQLLGGEAGASAQIGEVPLRRTGPDANTHRGIRCGSARRDEGCEDIDLAGSSRPWEFAAKALVVHASRLAAASHSSRPSLGIS